MSEVWAICVCGRPIRPPTPESGYDLDWVHEDGAPFCEESGHLDDAGEWHDPPFAEPRYTSVNLLDPFTPPNS